MSADASSRTRNYLERRLFDHFLRTGVQVDIDALVMACERKFNPYHDPDDGRFTFAPGGGSLAARKLPGSNPSPLNRVGPKIPVLKLGSKPLPARQARPEPRNTSGPDSSDQLGSLSARYETGRLGVETVSSGRGRGGVPDRGGVSYGSYQLTSQTPRYDVNGRVFIVKDGGNVARFLAAEGKRWAVEFEGLDPGSAKFSDVWRRVARRDGDALRGAEHAWVKRNNYHPAVIAIKNATGFDIDRAPSALRDVVWSVAVQHGAGNANVRRGGAAKIITDAIKRTDLKTYRVSSQYNNKLIENIYTIRGKYWPSDHERYSAELQDALRRLNGAR